MKVQFLGLILIGSAVAQSQSIRATITGQSGNDGKCTFEVEVDGAAEVEIRGDRGSIRQLSGQSARWRRLTCTQPLPNNPGSFRFKGIDGRGRQQLVRDPNSTGGVAVIRIEDPKGGSEGYTGDIEWNGGNNNYEGVGNWDTGRDPSLTSEGWNRRISNNEAMRICKNQVVETRNVQANRVSVRHEGSQQREDDHRISFTFRNANGATKRGFCQISGDGQILQFQVEGLPNANRTSWNQALNSCQEEAARRLGVSVNDVLVQLSGQLPSARPFPADSRRFVPRVANGRDRELPGPVGRSTSLPRLREPSARSSRGRQLIAKSIKGPQQVDPFSRLQINPSFQRSRR